MNFDGLDGALMRSNIAEMSSKVVRSLVDWVRCQTIRSIQCRECDLEVSITETACPRCGASDPARIPWAAVTAVIAVSVGVIIIAVMIFG